MDLHLSNSVTDEAGMAYVARGLEFGEAEPEDSEDLVIKKIPLVEALSMIRRGEITDTLSICALLQTKLLIDSGEI